MGAPRSLRYLRLLRARTTTTTSRPASSSAAAAAASAARPRDAYAAIPHAQHGAPTLLATTPESHDYLPLAAQPLFHSPPSSREEALELIPHYAKRQATPVSLRSLVEFGRNPAPKKLLLAAQLLHRELPIRLAHRVEELQTLPYGLSAMPSVRKVRELYVNSFADLVMHPRPEQEGEEERRYAQLLRRIRERHTDVVQYVARGVLELKQQCGFGAENLEVASFLDRFYTSRIGIRVLISQQVSMSLENARQGYVGIINPRCRPAYVAWDAIEAARSMAYRHLGEEAAEVQVLGNVELEFPYIEGHLYHILFELLKNSLRAVTEAHRDALNLPPVKLIIADGNEDVTIKIADEAGGIPRSSLPKIWTYMFSTAEVPPHVLIENEAANNSGGGGGGMVGYDPLAGFGYGLPLSRLYARYFGGELSIMSMEGYGTDAYVHICKLGNRLEAGV